MAVDLQPCQALARIGIARERERRVVLRRDAKALAICDGCRGLAGVSSTNPVHGTDSVNAATDWTEIAELITESYLMMAPKKLAAEVEAALRRSTNDAP